MYVIFPADEIILLSYGFAQNPQRLLSERPTLDHLREPLVFPPSTTGIRPPINQTTILRQDSLSPNINHVLPTSNNKVRRDPSPSVSFVDDYMYKSRTSLVDDQQFINSNTKDTSAAVEGNGTKKKSKLKAKIPKISLGKLGKVSASNEQLETASSTRVTDDLELRIANPTFTRDNLRQKNFDAFFASGEPVYSLERKSDNILSSILTPSLSIDTPLSPSPSTPLSPISYKSSTPSPTSHHRGSSAGFHSPTPPIRQNHLPSKQSSSPNSGSGNKRPKSAEVLRPESFVKGDRCPRDFLKRKIFFRFVSPLIM
jgi:hypothetical protein